MRSNGGAGDTKKARKKGHGADIMKKRIFSLILAALLILSSLAFAACDKEPADGGSSTGGGTEGTNETPNTEGNEEPSTNKYGLSTEFFEDYKRDESNVYYGKMGVGGKNVSFDRFTIKVSSKNAYVNDFESSAELPEGLFETFGGSLSDWKVDADTVTDGNKILSYTGSDSSILTVGNAEWGKSNLKVSVALAEGGEAEVYFCVRDDKNFYRLTVSSDAKTGVKLDEVKDGKETNVGALAHGEPTGIWMNVSVDIGANAMFVYVDGVEMFRIEEKAVAHTYSGLMGIAQWNTEFYVDNVKIEDPVTGEVYYEQDFEDGTFLDNCTFGERNGASWSVDSAADDWELLKLDDGNTVLHFKNSGVYGAVALFDPKLPEGCASVKITYQGYKLAGSEGYAFVWDWQADSVDANGDGADYMAYNLGGWTGKSGFQEIVGGAKTNYEGSATVGLQNEVWQTVEIDLTPSAAFGCFEGVIYETFWYAD